MFGQETTLSRGEKMGANIGDFDSVYDIFNRNVVYVIPTFQRPYAWEEKQLSDLISDIFVCCGKSNPYHYLSPIHLVEVDSPQEEMWKNYTDKDNEDILNITNAAFTDDHGKFKVYLVVDGQQRLTTLFSLLFIISGNKVSFLKLLCEEKEIPKIILNPANDHQYFRNLLNLPYSQPSIISKSQQRLNDLFNTLSNINFNTIHQNFITGRKHVSLLISLDPNYGLQTFLTLNDRGKDLTTFEKLKSLFMDYDFNYCSPSNPVDIHNTFGNIYIILDHHDCYVNEEQFVQLSAIDLWVANDSDIPSKAADTIYKDYFRTSSPSTKNVGQNIHTKWLPSFSQLSNQISHLTNLLNGSNLLCNNSSNIVSNRTVEDDYKVIFHSLGLSLPSLAVLLKFREVFSCEWQDIVCDVQFNNNSIKNTLIERINTVLGIISQNEVTESLRNLANNLNNRIQSISTSKNRNISILHIVEMMELIVFKMGSTKPGTYSGTWNAAFIQNADLIRAAKLWFDYIISYGTRDGFYYFLLNGQPDARDRRFRYILSEYEFFKYQKNIHFNKNLQIEHIFSQNINPIISSLKNYGFMDAEDYQKFSELIGNKIFLDSSLNSSIKDQPIHVKAHAYQTQSYARTNVSSHNQTQSSIEIGNILLSITNPLHYKIYLEIRQIELVLFALQRF